MRVLLIALAVAVVGLAAASYRDRLNLYLHDFEELAKEHIFVENVANFSIPSAAIFYVRIELQEKVFHASLRPHFALFHKDLEVIHRTKTGPKRAQLEQNEWLEGELMNEPDSRVLIHLKDNVVTGTILTSDNEKYYIEPSHRHVKEPHDFHMISYKHSDVKFNITLPEDGGHFCGHESHEGKPTDPTEFHFSLPPKRENSTSDEYIQYTRRRKRATDEEVKNRCPLALIGDYKFYKEVNNEEEANAVNYMVGIMQQIIPMYKDQSLDPDGGEEWTDYTFIIRKIEVIMDEEYLDDTSSYLHTVEKRGVSDLLKSFAYGEWDSYCLAHLFTNYDFDGGVLGLAYVASSALNRVGGVCTKTYKDGTGKTRYLNVGLSTCQNYGRSLLTAELKFVTAHEFGHNWGSSHDSDTSEECAPSGNRYLMYPAAVDGSQSNNHLFSPCSKQAINDVLVAKSDICFTSASAAVCGNGYLEAGEECDPGPDDTICCASCKLTSGSKCEPANNECCEAYDHVNACSFKAENSVCKDIDQASSKDCIGDWTCSAAGVCTEGAPVSGVACFDNGMCLNGDCQDICKQQSPSKESCLCSGDDICLICCKDTTDGECTVLTGSDAGNLTNGKLCGNGHCNMGVCEIGAQDIQERIWELMDEIDVNMILRWFRNNIVFTIILFTSIFWIPISIFVDWLDDKYDLGVLDDILGSSEAERKREDREKLIPTTSSV